MGRLVQLALNAATLGSRPQAFLGAKWIPALLSACPSRLRRGLALQLIAASPHYFYRHVDPRYQKLSRSDFLIAEHRRMRKTRSMIRDEILRQYLPADAIVADWGCGPGYLARAMSGPCRRVIGIDISEGALSCARILNGSPNCTFLLPDMPSLRDWEGKCSLVYSIAVLQHVTDEVLEEILRQCFALLRPGGRAVMQVQLLAPGWRTESEWRRDKSPSGLARFRLGLHCFARSRESMVNAFQNCGFDVESLVPVSKLVSRRFDDVCDQHIVIATRPSKVEPAAE